MAGRALGCPGLLRRAVSLSWAAGMCMCEGARGVATGARLGGGFREASWGLCVPSLLPRKPRTVHTVLVPQYAAQVQAKI